MQTQTFRRPPPAAPAADRGDSADRGSAMVITLMVLALVTALSTTVAVVTVNNLQGSWRAQQAGEALSAADAGIAQAVAHLRTSGVRDLTCTSDAPASAGCARLWGSANPIEVSVPSKHGASYEVWIEAVLPFPANDPGSYRIHSTGSAAGPASREVVTDLSVTSTDVPQGIFSRTINGGGNASVKDVSIFSTGCVYSRSKIDMSGIDAAYGIPAAVHSSQYIVDANGNGSVQYCATPRGGPKQPIHYAQPCATAFPYDQDALGGSLTGTTCESAQTSYPEYYGAQDLNGDGSNDVRGSFIKDDATLFELFGIRSPALTTSQVDQLRTIAQSQQNYWTSSSGWTSPDEANSVMYFDLAKTDLGGSVNLNSITGFGRTNMTSSNPACATRSLVVVVDGGNVKLNANQQLVASVFLLSGPPYGQVLPANGTTNFIGTMYADNVNLTGTADLSMDTCFLDNLSPALLDFTLGRYRELDR